jgi:hypothetical protein
MERHQKHAGDLAKAAFIAALSEITHWPIIYLLITGLDLYVYDHLFKVPPLNMS